MKDGSSIISSCVYVEVDVAPGDGDGALRWLVVLVEPYEESTLVLTSLSSVDYVRATIDHVNEYFM